jgi:hypothetical protein
VSRQRGAQPILGASLRTILCQEPSLSTALVSPARDEKGSRRMYVHTARSPRRAAENNPAEAAQGRHAGIAGLKLCGFEKLELRLVVFAFRERLLECRYKNLQGRPDDSAEYVTASEATVGAAHTAVDMKGGPTSPRKEIHSTCSSTGISR